MASTGSVDFSKLRLCVMKAVMSNKRLDWDGGLHVKTGVTGF